MRHRRPVLVRWALAATVVGVLAGCGGGGEPTVEVRGNATSTTFVTLPPPSSTTAPPPTVAPASGSGRGDGADEATPEEPADQIDPVTGNRLYTVERNDYLLRIATKFEVTPEEIADANGWSSIGHNINPGDQIQIPPVDDPADTDAGADGASASGSGVPESGPPSSEAVGARCEDGSETQTYTIQRGDIPARVARRFDVTVEELAAANAGTPGYRNFIVGTEITIPC